MLWFLYIVFSFVTVLLVAVILLQEGKGGGMGAAFGGVGGEAFGHGAGGINRFTGVLAGIFMVAALVIAIAGRGTY
ncbi:MAG: preprotein translocase subunit SecG [Planctomycetota bacterium]